MPLAATRAPYTLFIVDDDMPLNPREDCDCLGKMLCWHGRYSLGEKHDFEEPRDFLQELLFSEYSSGHDRDNPVFAFLIRFAPSVQLKRMKRSAFCQSGISFRHIKAIYTGIFGIFLVLLAHIS